VEPIYASLLTLVSACAPGIAPQTMHAVVLHESRGAPFAISINGPHRLARQPASAAEAIATAERLHAQGFNFDSGLGQLNSANVARFGASWADVFDPCENVRLAARVLRDCYERSGAHAREPQARLAAALSCYNTGNPRAGYANGYVAAVYAAARRSPTPTKE
jgi:type IV secretion system protein VirB1